MSPEIVEDVQDEVSASWKGGLMYGLGTGLGASMLGPIGYAAGGVAAGAYEGGTVGQTLSTLAIGQGTSRLIQGGMAGGSNQSGRRRV